MELIDNAASGKSSRTNKSSLCTSDGRRSSSRDEKEEAASTEKILYGVEECPPWYLCALLGLQVGSYI